MDAADTNRTPKLWARKVRQPAERVMSSRPATEADMLCEALRLAGVDVSAITGEQLEKAAAEYTRMSRADATARIESAASEQYARRLACSPTSREHSYFSGVVHGLEVAAGVVRPSRAERGMSAALPEATPPPAPRIHCGTCYRSTEGPELPIGWSRSWRAAGVVFCDSCRAFVASERAAEWDGGDW